MGKTISIKVLFGIYLLLMAGKVFAFSCNVDGGSRQPMDKQETRLQPEPSSQSLVSLLSMNNCDFDLSLCAPFTKIARIIIL